MAVFNEKEEIMKRTNFSTVNLNKKQTLKKMISTYKLFKKTYPIKQMGISTPGSINSFTGQINGNSAIKNYRNFNLYDDLKILLKDDDVRFIGMNDANCALLAELRGGVAKDCSSVVLLAIGTGLGGAVATNHDIWTGANGFAGEFGYMIGLTTKINVFNYNASLFTSVTSYIKGYIKMLKGKHPQNINGEYISQLVELGDPIAKKAADQYISRLARIIYNLHVCLDPELFVLAGGGSKLPNIVELLAIKVREYLNTGYVFHNQTKIVVGKYQHDAGLYGAQFLTKEKKYLK